MEKLFWVGPRESDIWGLDSLFSGSITLYGSDTGGNCSYCGTHGLRINHNVDHPASSAFILERQMELIRQYPDCQFMSYNPNYTHGAPEAVASHSICLNRKSLLEMLDNKRSFRAFARDMVPMLESQVRRGRECTYAAPCKAPAYGRIPRPISSRRPSPPGARGPFTWAGITRRRF